VSQYRIDAPWVKPTPKWDPVGYPGRG